MIDFDDDELDEPDVGRLVAEDWPEFQDPREDIYTEEDGLPVPRSDDPGRPVAPNPLPKTLSEATEYFSSPDRCREYVAARRWPNGITCPVCGSASVYFDSSRHGWECKTRHRKRKFTLKTGTLFEDSPLGFDKWLPAVWMITNCKDGMSPGKIQRAVGVSYMTAWFMTLRIHFAMQAKVGGQLNRLPQHCP